MASSETIETDEPIAAIIDEQVVAEAEVTPELTELTYVRADGTVEHAKDSADAIKRCSYLAELAITAPQEANLFLKLAAKGATREPTVKGSEKTHIDQKSEPPVQKPTLQVKIEQENVSSRGMQAQDLGPSTTEQLLRQSREDQVAPLQEVVPEVQPIATKEPSQAAAAVEISTTTETQSEEVVKTEAIISKVAETNLSTELADTATLVRQRLQFEAPLRLASSAVQTEAAPQPAAIVARAIQSSVKPVERPITAVEVINQTAVVSERLSSSNAPAEPASATIEAPEIVTWLADMSSVEGPDAELAIINFSEPEQFGSVKEFFDWSAITNEAAFIASDPTSEIANSDIEEQAVSIEAMAVYQQLVALPEASLGQPPDVFESEEVALAIAPLPYDQELPIAEPLPSFESFIEAQPVPSEPLTLELLHAQTVEQPLEQSLRLLVEYFSDATEIDEVQREAQTELFEIIRQLERAIPNCYEPAGKEAQPHITPEMTDKLLLLLQTLGYQEPADVLIDFVSNHGLGFLLEAIEYLSQLKNTYSRHEFLTALTVPSSDDATSRLHIAKTLFRLVAYGIFAPNVHPVSSV